MSAGQVTRPLKTADVVGCFHRIFKVNQIVIREKSYSHSRMLLLAHRVDKDEIAFCQFVFLGSGDPARAISSAPAKVKGVSD
jgi:vancomycin permeability regulator SanA